MNRKQVFIDLVDLWCFRKKLKKSNISELLDMSKQTISALYSLNNTRDPTFEHIFLLCKILNVSLYLMPTGSYRIIEMDDLDNLIISKINKACSEEQTLS